MKAKKPPQNFETAINELEQIINRIENSEIDLEESINQYQNGIELIKFCQHKLRDIEQKVKILDSETNQLKDFPTE